MLTLMLALSFQLSATINKVTVQFDSLFISGRGLAIMQSTLYIHMSVHV